MPDLPEPLCPGNTCHSFRGERPVHASGLGRALVRGAAASGSGILLSALRRPHPRIHGAEWARRVAACVCLLIFGEANDGGPVDDLRGGGRRASLGSPVFIRARRKYSVS
jgi:hypothetical protein